MLYDFKTPTEYEEFINKHTAGAFSTFDMEAILPFLKKLKKGQTYLEVGVDRGKSLLFARLATKEGVNVVGVDVLDTPERREMFRSLGLERHASFIHGESTNVAKVWEKKIDLLFIDGDHTYDGCMRDIVAWFPRMNKGGHIFFHDCDESSPGVVDSVNEQFGLGRVKLYKTPSKNTSMAMVTV